MLHPSMGLERRKSKKNKKFIDHILLLFNFEKPYFDKENMSNEFVGHPLLDDSKRVQLI